MSLSKILNITTDGSTAQLIQELEMSRIDKLYDFSHKKVEKK